MDLIKHHKNARGTIRLSATSMRLSLPLILTIVFMAIPLRAEERMIFTAIDGSVLQSVSEVILREAYHRIGVKIYIEPQPGERALISSNSGIVDGEVSRIKGITKKYTNLIRVPVPINYLEGVVFTKSVKFPIKGWDSLKPYKIGRLIGSKFVERGTKGMNSIPAASAEQLYTFLNDGQVDIVVNPRLDGLVTLQELNMKDIHILQPPVTRLELYHYLHKKHEHLIPKITNALRDMEKEGKFQTIRQQFITE